MNTEYNILSFLQKNESSTALSVSEGTGYSVVTVNHILSLLLKEGRVVKKGQEFLSKGRPASLYDLDENNYYYLIVGLFEKEFETGVFVRVINQKGSIVYENELHFLKFELSKLKKLIKNTEDYFPQIKKIILGIPGQVRDDKVIICDVGCLVGVTMQELSGLPIKAFNDIDAALFSDINNSEIKAGIYLPEHFAPGVGLVINGKPYLGSNGLVGENCFSSPGFDFTATDSADEKIKNINYILRFIAFILNPDTVILYSELFTEENIKKLDLSIEEGHGIGKIIIKQN